MITYKVRLQGRTPLLMNAYTIEEKDGVQSSNKDYSDEWKNKVYLNASGNVCIPIHMLMACFQSGSKGLKSPKSGLVFLSRLIAPTFKLMDTDFEIKVGGKPVNIERMEIDNMFLKIAGRVGTARILRIRPCFRDWEIEFDLVITDSTHMTDKTVEQIISRSGSYAGLGDWRPSAPKPGAYGQFDVINFMKANV